MTNTIKEKVNRFRVYEKMILQPNETRTAKWYLAYSCHTLEDALRIKKMEEQENEGFYKYKIVDAGKTEHFVRADW